VLRKIAFVAPMAPTPAEVAPTGPEWLHEVKFDGWRAQLHVECGSATLYSKNGADFRERFRGRRSTIESIPIRSAVIDCELVACDETGTPCFQTLMTVGNRAPALCLWCFDLLYLDGVRLMPMPLVQRKAILADLVTRVNDTQLQFSGGFDDPLQVLETCKKMNLEGIVSKRRDSAYRSGPTRDWLKTKTATWRAAN
jgi:bifunctional non-homologous end joining protein LigD